MITRRISYYIQNPTLKIFIIFFELGFRRISRMIFKGSIFKVTEMGLTFFIFPALFLLIFINLVPTSAAQTAESASITLDRESYPVPWGTLDDFEGAPLNFSPAGRAIFPLHLTAVYSGGGIDVPDDTLGNGDVIIHMQIHDPDFNISSTKQDQISQAGSEDNDELSSHGPVKVYVNRGEESVLLATVGFQKSNGDVGRITPGATVDESGPFQTREIGPITETEPNSGIFEFDLAVRYTDGPASEACPDTTSYVSASSDMRSDDYLIRFDDTSIPLGSHCILNGDVLTVEYGDSDEEGSLNVVTDSATFEMTTGSLETDKDAYIIGSKAVITLTDPDLNLDSNKTESYPIDLIEWDSASATVTMGSKGGQIESFNPIPLEFMETGPNTGMFKTTFQAPTVLNNNTLQRGEEIALEYTDWGTSGSDYVGHNDDDVLRIIYTMNFGALIELDKEMYNSTDKVHITITAPTRNLDSDAIEHIGTLDTGELRIQTITHNLTEYKLDETGPNTGVFSGELTLNHETTSGTGPNDGLLQVESGDGIVVVYEFSEDETIVGSAVVEDPIVVDDTVEPDDTILPPLQQIEQGVPPDQIQCEETLQLVHKSSNGEAVCVTPETKRVLIDRDWAL